MGALFASGFHISVQPLDDGGNVGLEVFHRRVSCAFHGDQRVGNTESSKIVLNGELQLVGDGGIGGAVDGKGRGEGGHVDGLIAGRAPTVAEHLYVYVVMLQQIEARHAACASAHYGDVLGIEMEFLGVLLDELIGKVDGLCGAVGTVGVVPGGAVGVVVKHGIVGGYHRIAFFGECLGENGDIALTLVIRLNKAAAVGKDHNGAGTGSHLGGGDHVQLVVLHLPVVVFHSAEGVFFNDRARIRGKILGHKLAFGIGALHIVSP